MLAGTAALIGVFPLWFQVYDTPPMVVKGPSGGQDIYDTPAITDKNAQQMVKLVFFFLFDTMSD